MKPIRTQLLVKPFKSDEISSGGLFVPESAREISNKVVIIDVGNGTKKNPMLFKKGQIAFRVKEHGTQVLINDELHYLLDQSTILATM